MSVYVPVEVATGESSVCQKRSCDDVASPASKKPRLDDSVLTVDTDTSSRRDSFVDEILLAAPGPVSETRHPEEKVEESAVVEPPVAEEITVEATAKFEANPDDSFVTLHSQGTPEANKVESVIEPIAESAAEPIVAEEAPHPIEENVVPVPQEDTLLLSDESTVDSAVSSIV